MRSVIVERGLPFAVLSVAASPAGWKIRVRAGTRGTIAFTVRPGPSLTMRAAIQQQLGSGRQALPAPHENVADAPAPAQAFHQPEQEIAMSKGTSMKKEQKKPKKKR